MSGIKESPTQSVSSFTTLPHDAAPKLAVESSEEKRFQARLMRQRKKMWRRVFKYLFNAE